MAEYTVSIASKKTGVASIPCKSVNHAKKLIRLYSPFMGGDRFIKMVKV